MEQEEKITLRERADLGPVLARADHRYNAIEVNKKAFYGLPPMVQEFVLCHEVCHLKHNEWDENRTNELATRLFLDRSRNREDREARQEFLSYLDDNGGYSNFALSTLLSNVFSFGTSIYGVIKQRNAGWYSWNLETQKANLDVMLRQAFEESRRSGSQNAADFFWAQMRTYTNKDGMLEEFLARSSNWWVEAVIGKYEKKYGFGFSEVTPIDITAFPLVMLAIGAAIGYIVYKIVKKMKK